MHFALAASLLLGSTSFPTEPPAALQLIAALNRWCSSHDDCDVAERRDAYPDRVAHGETSGFISAQREQLKAFGTVAVWDGSRRRFMTQVEWDLRLMIGGMFPADHIGPELHDAILRRARARPELYLGVLVERVIGASPDPSWLAHSFVTYGIELLQDRAPETAVRAAQRLEPIYAAALRASSPPPANDEHRASRLQRELAALQRLRVARGAPSSSPRTPPR